jgi:hydroxyacylglutathione hydrolase
MIRVKSFYAYNELRNFSYLLYEDTTGDAWIIDPYEAAPIIQYIKKHSLSLQGILNTHRHHDHIRGNAPLMAAFDSRVMHFQNGVALSLDSRSILEVIDSPGHTLDHQVFVLKDPGKAPCLFSGDTLFNAGVGNCKNGGNVGLLFSTTKKLMEILPLETVLYPGHDYLQKNLEFSLSVEPENARARERLREVQDEDVNNRRASTLGEEMRVNPFLRLGAIDDMKSDEREIFQQLRLKRDVW